VTVPARLHGDDCTCTRCTGFEPGHDLSTTHGAYSNGLALTERAAEIADGVRRVMPHYAPADEGMVRLLAISEVRIEKATAAINRADDAAAGNELTGYVGDGGITLERLRTDLRAWINLARRLRNDLALGTAARGRLGLDVALAQRASDQALDRLGAEGRRIRESREDGS
jgi:hypothetical protein